MKDFLAAASEDGYVPPCVVSPETFFPLKGAGGRIDVRAAKRACMGCAIRPACLEHALTYGEKWGVWGGMTERERRKERARRLAVAARRAERRAAG